MPYEGNDGMTEEFADQLHLIENIISNNIDCHIIVGGDFNVDLSRAWFHTAMVNSFCSNTDLCHALRHDKSQVIMLTVSALVVSAYTGSLSFI